MAAPLPPSSPTTSMPTTDRCAPSKAQIEDVVKKAKDDMCCKVLNLDMLSSRDMLKTLAQEMLKTATKAVLGGLITHCLTTIATTIHATFKNTAQILVNRHYALQPGMQNDDTKVEHKMSVIPDLLHNFMFLHKS
ncbi:hypothetical protein PAXINDRAFT_17440 [Paxillus involutus ATCC 200175]|uniref:Uncharacterized protein n=1 Tax=Paxillus involutus ATCC 200175 TaxID=664439 RepID=A0A0C9TEU7_PAXIN|nr:hypothetical protein PAXINDRAFT_17440 [Paxillus involutus ATCC 200175]